MISWNPLHFVAATKMTRATITVLFEWNKCQKKPSGLGWVCGGAAIYRVMVSLC
jgi:hypothetical protein